MKKVIENFNNKYEIYENGKINWYVVLFATIICLISGLILIDHIPAPAIAALNLMLIMPLSPVAVLHIRERIKND